MFSLFGKLAELWPLERYKMAVKFSDLVTRNPSLGIERELCVAEREANVLSAGSREHIVKQIQRSVNVRPVGCELLLLKQTCNILISCLPGPLYGYECCAALWLSLMKPSGTVQYLDFHINSDTDIGNLPGKMQTYTEPSCRK
ncbi:unnamed protein product [Caretta caretta]